MRLRRGLSAYKDSSGETALTATGCFARRRAERELETVEADATAYRDEADSDARSDPESQRKPLQGESVCEPSGCGIM